VLWRGCAAAAVIVLACNARAIVVSHASTTGSDHLSILSRRYYWWNWSSQE
jgi:hypothetical protein